MRPSSLPPPTTVVQVPPHLPGSQNAVASFACLQRTRSTSRPLAAELSIGSVVIGTILGRHPDAQLPSATIGTNSLRGRLVTKRRHRHETSTPTGRLASICLRWHKAPPPLGRLVNTEPIITFRTSLLHGSFLLHQSTMAEVSARFHTFPHLPILATHFHPVLRFHRCTSLTVQRTIG